MPMVDGLSSDQVQAWGILRVENSKAGQLNGLCTVHGVHCTVHSVQVRIRFAPLPPHANWSAE